MFKNSKWTKRIAMVMVIVMSVMTLASCQSGRTYEDVAGDASAIYVTGKEQQPTVPYTGDPIVKYTKVDDPNLADESYVYGQGPGSSGSTTDDTTGGTTDDTTGGTTDDTTGGTTDDTTGGTTDDTTGGTTDDTTGGTTDDTTGGEDEEVVEYDQGNFLKIVSYNLRVGNDGDGNDIKDRAPRLEKVMNDIDADIMGFQEVNPTWLDTYLIPYFADEYDYIHQYRAESSKEGTPLFWKKDKFELLDSGYFWLSETPDTESKGWGASHYRICMWAKLKIKATGKTFLFYNTHFDFNDNAHMGSAALIIKKAQALGGFSTLPVFFTADCNMQRYGAGYQAMLAAFSDINMDLEDLNYKTGGGYHLDGHEGLQSGSPIDYCFYSSDLVYPLKYQIIDEKVDGGYVSDHKGLYIEAALK